MSRLGPIVRLQVQPRSLKVLTSQGKRYNPNAIAPVPQLIVDDGGASGRTADGDRISDVHHRDHPQSKNRGENPISLLFTSHYATMRSFFGPHLVDGVAGESILVETDRTVREEEVVNGVIIVKRDGQRVHLKDLVVAEPCAEFALYALDPQGGPRPGAEVSRAIIVLRDGLRGYYARYDGEEVEIGVGDTVMLAS